MEFIMKLAITPVILLIAAKYMHSVYIKDTKAAIITSVVFWIVGFFVGWLITFILNILTLGIIWAVGLGIITRTIANAVVLEIVDAILEDFDTKGFLPSLWVAIMMAIGWALMDYMF